MKFLVFVISMLIHPVIKIGDFFEIKKEVAKTKSILLIGDSLAQGMSSHFNKIARDSGYFPVAKCLSGSRIDYWSPKFEGLIRATRPTMAIISLGTNDSMMTLPENQRKFVKNIKNVAERNHVRILWIMPQKLPEKFKSQDSIKKIINEEIKEYIYDDPNIKLEKTEDKVHLTGRGYGIWMHKIWSFATNKKLLIN
jgi:hypothetical protein